MDNLKAGDYVIVRGSEWLNYSLQINVVYQVEVRDKNHVKLIGVSAKEIRSYFSIVRFNQVFINTALEKALWGVK